MTFQPHHEEDVSLKPVSRKELSVKINPLKNQVFLIPQDGIRKGAVIALPPGTTLEDKVLRSKVAAIGPACVGEYKEGDFVLHSKWSGQLTKLEGQEYIVAKDEDLLMVVDADAEVQS